MITSTNHHAVISTHISALLWPTNSNRFEQMLRFYCETHLRLIINTERIGLLYVTSLTAAARRKKMHTQTEILCVCHPGPEVVCTKQPLRLNNIS